MSIRYLSIDEIVELLTGRSSDEVVKLLADKDPKPKAIFRAPRDCSECGNRFTPRDRQQIYCGEKCRQTAKRKRRSDIQIDLTKRHCEWCGKELHESVRSHAKYCSNKCRLDAYGAIPCTYCGEPADSRDHFIPRAFVRRIEDLGWAKDQRVIVPACRECNSIAGDRVFASIKDKRGYIHSRLKVKYGKVLDMPHWSQSEINQLGPTLKSHIVHSQHARTILLSRLRWKMSTHLDD